MVKIGKTSEGKINHVIIADRYLLMLDAQKKPSGFQAIIHMCVCTMCRSLIPQAKLKVVSNTEHWARDQTMVFGRWQVAVHTWTMNMGVRKWWKLGTISFLVTFLSVSKTWCFSKLLFHVIQSHSVFCSISNLDQSYWVSFNFNRSHPV